MSADSVYLHGFELAYFSEGFFGMLSEKTRAGVIKRTNPLDLGDVFDFNVYLEITERALQEEGVDGILLLHSYALGVDFEPSIRFISGCGELSRKYEKPVILCTIAHKEHWLAMREAADIPVFTHVDDARLRSACRWSTSGGALVWGRIRPGQQNMPKGRLHPLLFRPVLCPRLMCSTS